MSTDDEVKQFVDNYIMPAFKAAIELLKDSKEPEDMNLVEELKQLI